MTETVTAYLTTKNSISLTLVTLLAITSPYLHLFATSGQKGVFGFKYMGSFLFALGWPLCIINISILFLIIAKHTSIEIKKGVNTIAYIVMGLGVYYLLYTLIPIHQIGLKDFPGIVYYATLFVFTIISVIAINQVQRGLLFAEKKIQRTIKALSEFIIKSEKYIDNPRNKKSYFKDYMTLFKKIK